MADLLTVAVNTDLKIPVSREFTNGATAEYTLQPFGDNEATCEHLKEGRFCERWPSGGLAVVGHYRRHKRSGQWTIFDRQGNAVRHQWWCDGTLIKDRQVD